MHHGCTYISSVPLEFFAFFVISFFQPEYTFYTKMYIRFCKTYHDISHKLFELFNLFKLIFNRILIKTWSLYSIFDPCELRNQNRMSWSGFLLLFDWAHVYRSPKNKSRFEGRSNTIRSDLYLVYSFLCSHSFIESLFV